MQRVFPPTCHFKLPWRWRRCCRAWWMTTWWTANESGRQTTTGPFPVKPCTLGSANWRSCNNRWPINRLGHQQLTRPEVMKRNWKTSDKNRSLYVPETLGGFLIFFFRGRSGSSIKLGQHVMAWKTVSGNRKWIKMLSGIKNEPQNSLDPAVNLVFFRSFFIVAHFNNTSR